MKQQTKQALTHAAFARSCGGPTYTAAQEVCFSVAFDGAQPCEFTGEKAQLARELFGAIAGPIPTAARSTFVLVKGARVGGSYAGGVEAVRRGLTVPWPSGAHGESLFCLFVGPDVRLAAQPWRYALGAVKANPELARRIESESDGTFTLRRDDGKLVTFECLPATRGGSALRGRSLACVVFTEFSFVRDEESVVNDQDLFNAVGPRIVPGGLVFIESTPWADVGLLHQLFTKNHGAPTTCVAAHAPTLLMRPDEVTRTLVENARDQNAENAAREYDALWIEAGSPLAILKPAWIARAFNPRPANVVVQNCYPGWFYYDGSTGGEDQDDRVVVLSHYEDWLIDDTENLPKAPDGSPWLTHQGSEKLRKTVKQLPMRGMDPSDPRAYEGEGYEVVTVRCRQTQKGNWFEVPSGDAFDNRVRRMLVIEAVWCVPRDLSAEAGLDWLIGEMRKYVRFHEHRPTSVVFDGFEEGLTSKKFSEASLSPTVLRWSNRLKQNAAIRMQSLHRDGLIQYADPNPVMRRQLAEFSVTRESGGLVKYAGRGRRDDHAACILGICMVLTELRVAAGDPWRALNERFEIGPTTTQDQLIQTNPYGRSRL